MGRDRRGRDRPLRVAFLTPTLDIGGAERQMLMLAAGLPDQGVEVRFLLLSSLGSMADTAVATGAAVHVLGLDRTVSSVVDPRSALAGSKAVRRYRSLTRNVDIVDAWLIPSMIFAAAAQPIARVPVLIGGRRSMDDIYATRSRVRRTAASFAARRMAMIVANSRVSAAESIERDRVAVERVIVIPNAVVIDAEGVVDRSDRRTRLGVQDDHLLVGCVGNLKPEKGHRHLLQAAAALRDQYPSMRYVFVGDGPLRSELADDITRLGLDGVVTLHGAEPDARWIYPALDLLVQASDTEGLPNAILEAAAAGLPIVATDVGGTSEILSPGVDGLLVPRGDATALAEAIGRMADDPGLRTRLGQAARRRAADFAPSRLVTATADLYRTLAARSSRSDP